MHLDLGMGCLSSQRKKKKKKADSDSYRGRLPNTDIHTKGPGRNERTNFLKQPQLLLLVCAFFVAGEARAPRLGFSVLVLVGMPERRAFREGVIPAKFGGWGRGQWGWFGNRTFSPLPYWSPLGRA